MIIPDRTGVILGYRVWRVIPGKWVPPSESLYAQTCHRSWSLTGPTSAYCPPRVQGDPGKPLVRRSLCEFAPSFGCTCGLYARYDPIQETPRLPYVVGSMLAWGRVIHHEERSFFRAEKALPIAFVRPRGGGGCTPGKNRRTSSFASPSSWEPRWWEVLRSCVSTRRRRRAGGSDQGRWRGQTRTRRGSGALEGADTRASQGAPGKEGSRRSPREDPRLKGRAKWHAGSRVPRSRPWD